MAIGLSEFMSEEGHEKLMEGKDIESSHIPQQKPASCWPMG